MKGRIVAAAHRVDSLELSKPDLAGVSKGCTAEDSLAAAYPRERLDFENAHVLVF
jgi:hypothetical protein